MIGTILAKGNPLKSKPVLLELWGSPEFGIHQKLVSDRDAHGTVILLKPLDYEKRTTYHLTVLANVRSYLISSIIPVHRLKIKLVTNKCYSSLYYSIILVFKYNGSFRLCVFPNL